MLSLEKSVKSDSLLYLSSTLSKPLSRSLQTCSKIGKCPSSAVAVSPKVPVRPALLHVFGKDQTMILGKPRIRVEAPVDAVGTTTI